jgi:hypothetical protein
VKASLLREDFARKYPRFNTLAKIPKAISPLCNLVQEAERGEYFEKAISRDPARPHRGRNGMYAITIRKSRLSGPPEHYD